MKKASIQYGVALVLSAGRPGAQSLPPPQCGCKDDGVARHLATFDDLDYDVFVDWPDGHSLERAGHMDEEYVFWDNAAYLKQLGIDR
jgi:hypothetical protein